jgi:hypothetical protein
MRKKYVELSYILVLLFCQSLIAQNSGNLWSATDGSKINSDLWVRDINPLTATYFSMNYEQMFNSLNDVAKRGDVLQFSDTFVTLPYFDGKLADFRVYEASVLHPDLQRKYPEIRSFIGYNIKTPNEIVRFSLSHKGFNAILLNTAQGTQYIDCLSKDRDQYMSYKREDLPSESFNCENTDEFSESIDINTNNSFAKNANDGVIRTYRLAMACTEEYAAFHVAQAGLQAGTDAQKKAAVLAEMNDVMTRVNAVYENELSVTMQIVANNENVIFLTDNFLSNNNLSLLIEESQQTISANIGEPFDIGHMLCTGPGGLAYVSQVCQGLRAGAVSGTGNPIGTQFEGILMHEMGHQYGSRHTFNGNTGACLDNGTPSFAYEPGSGTTIMAYSGICSPQNIQFNKDLYFHQKSLDAMWLNITNGGATCAAQMASGNSAPVADAGADYTIPSRTPYRLTGSSTDADGTGSHTYTWEQYDLGPAGLPSPTLLEGPLVRSFLPNTSSTRYIPQLEDYLDVFGQSTTWEVMSSVTRDINFRLTVRDNDVRGGQLAVDGMVVSVTNTSGPLRIISQNNNSISYEGLSTQTISWQVNGTNAGLGGAADVNILLSTDGGLTYDTTVLANTPNDGSQEVQIPNIDAANCRFMIEAVGNIFYNINFRDFAITANLSNEEQELNNLSIYPNPNNGEFHIGFDSSSGEAITVKVYDIRGRVIYTKLYTSVGRFDEVISLNNTQSGVYLLTLSDGPLKVTKKIIVD